MSITTFLVAQTIAPKKCNTCGKPLSQCQYKGRHPNKAAEEVRRKEEQKVRERESQRISEQRAKKEAEKKAREVNEKLRLAEQGEREEADRKANEENRILQRLISNMVYVQGGTYTMGATPNQMAATFANNMNHPFDDENPAHQVTVNSFSIGKYEITQAEWMAVMGSNPSNFKGDNLPVEQVSWNDCQTFIQKLNAKTGKLFRLPTEAEWEYAARGGNRSCGYIYCGSNTLGDVAWYSENSNSKTHPVGQKMPNELGLYDMSGNVFEWCSDWYSSNYYSNSPQNNPRGPSNGQSHAYRGGSWNLIARYSRSSQRIFIAPVRRFNLGLRVVLSE